ncbi:carbohydrate ABC transporter membrane protein 2, CUT1 family [Fervidobacterium pennivorans DSM 9078]|uniref:Carbohydrate ABC transporter membrane protein 2, CUT1 family n=1 Tax=Fervidobacterium pennivorans (strain DSM 9078 / Ven5) TaxID=771875 RepID=H9UAN8_FERPD|nr:carbohydrate ABC transporter permease [Fervidobacterium pennivorans]AFG34581.1 carbohydrate ABC transporter membrane protein 2, CUT1 family [Fervidobacterium pennivorans DSM 9078]
MKMSKNKEKKFRVSYYKTFKEPATKTIIYVVLIGIGYAYLYPLLYMITSSFMSVEDLVNPTVVWIPTKFTLDNFVRAWKVLEMPKALWNSVYTSAIPALAQSLITALIAYGLSRFEFPLKRFWIVLMLATFLIPTQVTLVTKYVLFSTLRLTDTIFATFLPAIFGQGIRSAIFILLYLNFFNMLPKAIDEAAEIDGANTFQIFYKIILPLSLPAIVTTFIFSLVWYWNETLLSGLLLGNKIKTLPLELRDFVVRYAVMFPTADGSAANRINEGIRMAATMITILPLLITYLFLQRQFVESLERTGITGE